MTIKSKQIYICPLCHSTHGSEVEAQLCIDGHVLPAEIVNARGYDEYENAPTSIYVKLTDGRTALYRLYSVIFEVPAC